MRLPTTYSTSWAVRRDKVPPWTVAINHAFTQITYGSQQMTHQVISLLSSLWPKPTSTKLPRMHKTIYPFHCHHGPNIILCFSLPIHSPQQGRKPMVNEVDNQALTIRIPDCSSFKRASWKYTSSATTRQVQRKFNMWFLHIEIVLPLFTQMRYFLDMSISKTQISPEETHATWTK